MFRPILAILISSIGLHAAPAAAAGFDAIFEPNLGQHSSSASFIGRSARMDAALSPDRATIGLASPHLASRVTLRFVGADTSARAEPAALLPSVSSYFTGPERAWLRGLPNYSGVRFRNIYPGIDAVYYASGPDIEYDLRAAAGADLSQLALAVEGASGHEIDAAGDLRIHTEAGDLLHRRPRIFQDGREIPGRYRIESGLIRFDIGSHDPAKPLVIDPVLFRLGTYFKKNAVDAAGSLYITDRPSPNTVTVRKLSALGVLLYTATLSVQTTGDVHIATGIGGTAFIAGGTNGGLTVKNPFQATLGGGVDAFIMKVNASGTDVDYSTYLGGVGDDTPNGIAVDASGAAYVTGTTVSANFPVLNALQAQLQGSGSAFITKLAAAGNSLGYSTYFGGGNGATAGTAIGLSAAGDVFTAGFTNSAALPLSNAIQPAKNNGNDGFVIKLAAHLAGTPTVVFSTYFGGSADDGVNAMAVDGAGNAHVLLNGAPGLPLVGQIGTWDGIGQIYLAKLNSAGNQLVFGTYFGGSSGSETGTSVGLDVAGSIYVSGYTTSSNFPQVSPSQRSPMALALARTANNGPAAFFTKFSSSLAVLYSQYMPAGDNVSAYAPNDSAGDVAVDLSANAYVGGFKMDPGTPIDPTVPLITAPGFNQVIPVSAVTVTWTPVAGTVVYDLKVFNNEGAAAFSGGIEASATPGALVNVFNGTYVARIRACTTRNQAQGNFTDCGAAVYQRFSVSQLAPTGAPPILGPSQGQVIQSSTIQFLWDIIPAQPVSRWEVRLTRGGVTELQIAVDGNLTATTYSVSSAGAYALNVRGCTIACGPWSTTRTFLVQLPPPPSVPGDVTDVQIANGNELSATWLTIPSADLYQIMVVQPNTGPGGGALTVAARQISTTSIVLQVPSGPASVIVRGCNANGCGPWGNARGINPPGPNPAAPLIGTPMAGTQVDGPVITFTWSRIANDNGSNTTYRLYVQDMFRQAAALDVLTTANFYGAALRAEGNRYDAVVIATQGGQTFQGPASGFIVRGASAAAPTMTSPQHNGTLTQGNIFLGWTPQSDAKLYEYYVTAQGQNFLLTGVSQGLQIQIPVPALNNLPALYNGIVRACTGGTGISDCQWGPWSNNGGGGITAFTVTP